MVILDDWPMLSVALLPVAHISDNYLSVCIDISQIIGKNWWSPSPRKNWSYTGKYQPRSIDLSNRQLIYLARQLGPSYLRIGGTLADDLYYGINDNALPKHFQAILTKKKWDEINKFARACAFTLLFTINAGKGPRTAGKKWNSANAESLIRYSKQCNYQLPVWEFGNEPNGYLFRGFRWHVSPKQYSKDYQNATRIVRKYYPRSKVAGCSSIYWPIIGEGIPYMKTFLRHGKGSIDVLSWHYYPQQSRRIPIATRRASPERMLLHENLNSIKRWITKIRSLRNMHAPGSLLWMTETGNALGGGEPGVSDTYASGFWWLDQIGLLAKYHHQIVFRQTLIGSHYGLLNEKTLQPYPDYWNSLLWKKLMGSNVLMATCKNRQVRVYAHSTPKRKNAVTALILNTSKREQIVAFDPLLGKHKEMYKLSAPHLHSKIVFLNGIELKLRNYAIPSLLPEKNIDTVIRLQPRTYAFIVFPKITQYSADRDLAFP